MHVGKARRLWRAFRLSTGKLDVRIDYALVTTFAAYSRRPAQSMGGNGLIVSFGEVMPMRLGRLQ